MSLNRLYRSLSVGKSVVDMMRNVSLIQCPTTSSFDRLSARTFHSGITSPNFYAFQPQIVDSHSETVIRVPTALQKRLVVKMEKEKTRFAQRQRTVEMSRRGNRHALILECRRKQYNHYQGQSYDRFKPIKLASSGWKNRRASGDYFTLRKLEKHLDVFDLSKGENTFASLGIKEPIIETLKSNGMDKPTHIQVFAIPEILNQRNCLIAAETGCGKTLAYMLPLFEQIMAEKKYIRHKRGFNQPFAIVLVPSRELADQTFQVAMSFASALDIRVKCLQGGSLSGKLANPPTSLVDVLVTTLNVSSTLTRAGIYDIKRVRHVVMDEADTLLDDSYSEDVIDFLRYFPFKPPCEKPVQLTLVSATMPLSVENILEDIVETDNLHRVTTPNLHRVMAHVRQTFHRVKKSEKPTMIMELLGNTNPKNTPTMIFCNKSKVINFLTGYLYSNGIRCVGVHGKMLLQNRIGKFQRYQDGEFDVIVSTDLASRGVDTIRTGHVINYDFPLSLADYIHRCGRTARVGSKLEGKVTSLVSNPREVELVNEIEECVRKDENLGRVDANVKGIFRAHFGMNQPIVVNT